MTDMDDPYYGREAKLLAGLDVAQSRGVEIGPCQSPIVRKADGEIFYVDHVDTETLRRKYLSDPVYKSENIVDVDGVWGDQTLKDCVGPNNLFDYVVASHVVEHVPDFVSWLQEIHSILKPNGTLRLAVPDRRYTFDHKRFESRIHDVLDAYLQRARKPLPRMIIDHMTHSTDIDSASAWIYGVDRDAPMPVGRSQGGLALAQNAIETGAYHDMHCWVFTPRSFAVLCRELNSLGLIKFSLEYYYETARNGLEFFVCLRASDHDQDNVASWEEMISASR